MAFKCILDSFSLEKEADHRFIMKLHRAHCHYRRCWDAIQCSLRRNKASDFHKRCNDVMHAHRLCKNLKGDFQPPLERLAKREADGTTSVATEPLEVDEIAREAWKPIFDGNFTEKSLLEVA